MTELTKLTLDMPLENVFFCGDIHGQVELLHQSLELAGFDKQKHRLFCTGDLIDYGKQSEEALMLLDEPWFYSVLGNHDDFMLQVTQGLNKQIFDTLCTFFIDENGLDTLIKWSNIEDSIRPRLHSVHPLLTHPIANWVLNGGWWWFDVYHILGYDARLAQVKRLANKSLPIAMLLKIRDKRFLLSHAAAPRNLSDFELPGLTLDTKERERLMWDREVFYAATNGIAQFIHGVDAVILGHNITKTKSPLVSGNTIFLDVGAKKTRQPYVISASNMLNLLRQQHLSNQ